MPKLSDGLKALINAPFARQGPTPAPRNIRAIFEKVKQDAATHHVGRPSWITLSTATTMTMNSPESMAVLYQVATASQPQEVQVNTAELMREVGLKCIGFNGIPRTINMLGAFRSSLPPSVVASLTTQPSRIVTPDNLPKWLARGRSLWDSVYRPFETKLLDKLADSHPDLPLHIINSNYAPLFTDPSERPSDVRVGRVLTSLVAIACLRAQTGVGPQVTSHIFGLRKAVEDGTWRAPEAMPEEGTRWLASEDGNQWILKTVDGIVEAIGAQQGTTFAPGVRAKL